jgi:hypothetical protein
MSGVAAVRLDELLALHEHAARAAAGVEHAALGGLDHLDQRAHHRLRGVEVPAQPPLGRGELGEEVLVHAAEEVLGVGFFGSCSSTPLSSRSARRADACRAAGRAKSLGKVCRSVVRLSIASIALSMPGRCPAAGLLLQRRPARLRAAPRTRSPRVLVDVLDVVALGHERRFAQLFERVRDVLEEESPSTTCLYSAGSMLPRSLSAASHRVSSKPMTAPEVLLPFLARPLTGGGALSAAACLAARAVLGVVFFVGRGVFIAGDTCLRGAL